MKKFYVPVLALLMLASCSKSELADRDVKSDMVEIKAASNALSIETRQTRAPFEGNISSSNQLEALVLVSKTASDYTTRYCEGVMAFSDTSTPASFATPQYYPVDDSEIYLCGLYPSVAADWKNISTTADYTFDGKTDVMAAKQVTSKKSTAASAVPAFEFKHLLTKLIVEVKAADDAAVTAWGNIVGLAVIKGDDSKVNSSVKVTLAGGEAVVAAFAAPLEDGLSCYLAGSDDVVSATNKIVLTTSAVEAAYSLVAPITAKDNSKPHFVLKVVTNNGGTDLEKEVPVTLKKDGATLVDNTQGKAFKIILTFKATGIQATASVTPWGEGGSSDVEIQ